MSDKPIIIHKRMRSSSDLDRIDRIFDRLINPWQHMLPLHDGKWRPNTDIFETEDDLIIRIELAGVDKDDINIILEKDHLAIYGHRADPYHDEPQNYYQMEINFHEFERIIVLPDELEPEVIDANFEAGMLIINIPKQAVEPRQHTYKVEIK